MSPTQQVPISQRGAPKGKRATDRAVEEATNILRATEGGQKLVDALAKVKAEEDAQRAAEKNRSRPAGDAWDSAMARLRRLQKEAEMLEEEAATLSSKMSYNDAQRRDAQAALAKAKQEQLEEQEAVAHTAEKATEDGTNGTSKAGTQAEEVNGDGTKKQKTEVPAPVELSQEMELIVTWARETKDQNLPWREVVAKARARLA